MNPEVKASDLPSPTYVVITDPTSGCDTLYYVYLYCGIVEHLGAMPRSNSYCRVERMPARSSDADRDRGRFILALQYLYLYRV